MDTRQEYLADKSFRGHTSLMFQYFSVLREYIYNFFSSIFQF